MTLMEHNIRLKKKYDRISQELKLFEELQTEDAELVIAAYGITARIAKGAVNLARKKGLKVGLIRPITLWPFPSEVFKKAAGNSRKILVVEMSNGQLVQDVRLAVEGKVDVSLYNRMGGNVPGLEEVINHVEQKLL